MTYLTHAERFRLNEDGSVPEHVWRKHERLAARAERQRLIKCGTIVPEGRMQPTPLIKNEETGDWDCGPNVTWN